MLFSSGMAVLVPTLNY